MTICFLSFSILHASPIESDIKILKKLVDKAYENLSLDYKLFRSTTNNKIFLQNAELRLRFAQINSSAKDFLDYDYMNLGLYLLSIRFQRYKAALVVLKKQLLQENDPHIIEWLKKRIRNIEKFQDSEKIFNHLEANKELQIFRKLFD
ncbi:MAG: hypothetical protein ACQETH_04035 [Candidatus Rifleibacteriota bacterium]